MPCAHGFDKYEVHEELQRYLRDVEDHTLRIVDRVDGFRTLLQNILTVNATLVGQRQNEETQRLTEASLAQNEEVKTISSWAAILFAPTLVGTIYGMNFDHMPELYWAFWVPLRTHAHGPGLRWSLPGLQETGLAVRRPRSSRTRR